MSTPTRLRKLLTDTQRELRAVRKAKAENDDRFMRERDEARDERDALRRERDVLAAKVAGYEAAIHPCSCVEAHDYD